MVFGGSGMKNSTFRSSNLFGRDVRPFGSDGRFHQESEKNKHCCDDSEDEESVEVGESR